MLILGSLLAGLSSIAVANVTTTTSIFLPIIASQTLLASLSTSSGDVKTMIIKCPDGTENCGFGTPATVTAGPSTVELTTTISALTVNVKCGIASSTSASCTQIYTGAASLLTTGSGIEGGATTTWTSSVTINSGSVTYLPVTITAGVTSTSGSPSNATTVHTGGSGPAPTPVAQAFAAGLIANAVLLLVS